LTNDAFSRHPVEKLLALMKNLTLNALRMFDAAARHQNFRRAADEWNLTQGAVAQQIRALEARLGKPLFRRLPRGLALTEAGSIYHTDISRALRIMSEATTRLTETATITLTVTPSLASKWLMPRLPELIEIMPEIDLKIHASEQTVDLLRGDVNLAIRQGPMPKDSALSVIKLCDIDYIAVAHPTFCNARLSITDVVQHRLIQDSHGHWDKLCTDFELPPPQATLNVNQTALAIDAAINGQGIALTPSLLVQTALDAGSLQSVWRDTRATDQGFYILFARDAASEKTVQVANWLAAQGAI
jgi:LysR family glycine cleavage system transcriptional activator